MKSTYTTSDHFFRDNGRVLRLNDSLGLFAAVIPTCIRATKRSSCRTSELTNSIATSSRCSKVGYWSSRGVKWEKKDGNRKRGETSWGRETEKESAETERRGDLRKGVTERGWALTNRMAKETRRFYRRSDRIYEYDQHQSFVSRKRDTHRLRLVSLRD